MTSHSDGPNALGLSFLVPALMTAFSVFSVAVTIIAMFQLCLIGGALHRGCSRRTNHHYLLDTDDSPPRVSSGRLLPRRRFKARPHDDNGGLCMICLEDLREGEWYRELPECKHVFHPECVDTWLAKAVACPYCRTAGSLP